MAVLSLQSQSSRSLLSVRYKTIATPRANLERGHSSLRPNNGHLLELAGDGLGADVAVEQRTDS